MFWCCASCSAYVGCHAGTIKPLGTLADKATRAARTAAHAAFDPTWQMGQMSRHAAYAWLAKQLGIDVAVCHIGQFDLVTCQRVVTVVAERTIVSAAVRGPVARDAAREGVVVFCESCGVARKPGAEHWEQCPLCEVREELRRLRMLLSEEED